MASYDDEGHPEASRMSGAGSGKGSPQDAMGLVDGVAGIE
jgi:hypothetical protein